jgi:hypothetical protein
MSQSMMKNTESQFYLNASKYHLFLKFYIANLTQCDYFLVASYLRNRSRKIRMEEETGEFKCRYQ